MISFDKEIEQLESLMALNGNDYRDAFAMLGDWENLSDQIKQLRLDLITLRHNPEYFKTFRNPHPFLKKMHEAFGGLPNGG